MSSSSQLSSQSLSPLELATPGAAPFKCARSVWESSQSDPIARVISVNPTRMRNAHLHIRIPQTRRPLLERRDVVYHRIWASLVLLKRSLLAWKCLLWTTCFGSTISSLVRPGRVPPCELFMLGPSVDLFMNNYAFCSVG